ncbi:hypothetical protein EWM64_g4194 [Hericium alpestre]|uniref:F-box domain-containing protein n=1 Tax=Hericium alpestre TaxID=135208 RepID=A0A4Z0A0F7_9AGAM|nr:hypothetical protein EWM64_g4194 [Hericium alpestre]
MSRIKTLQISWQAYSTYVPPKLMERMSQPAPFLESLYLSNLGGVWSTNPLPLTLFSGEIPRLTRLTILHGAQISWDSPLIQKTSLTHLHLGDMTHWKSDSIDRLLDVLERFPRLKSLLLEQSIPIGPTMSDRVVKLPALTGISLADDQSACMVLLRSLSIPPTALLSLQTFLNPQDGDVNPTLAGSLAHVVPFFKDTKTVRMHITKDAGVNQLRIQSWPTTITDRAVLGSPHSSSTLVDFMWSAEAAMDIGVIQNVCTILSLNGIEAYSGGILSFQNQHPNDWRPIFRDWTQLSTMHAIGTMLEVFLDAFVAPAEPPVAVAAAESEELPTTQPPPLLPSLRTLIIDRANITSELGERMKTSLRTPECKVQTVQIHQCNVKGAFVDELKEIVPDVQWDGKQNRTLRRPGPFWATGGAMEIDGFETMDDGTEEPELVLGSFDGEP